MFEGTPEEFREVSDLLVFDESGMEKQKPSVDKDTAIKKALQRRPISDGQRAVFRALANGPITYDELLQQTGRKSGEMAGILGAMGRRINNTPEIHGAGLPGSIEAIIHYEKIGTKTQMSLDTFALEVLVIAVFVPFGS